MLSNLELSGFRGADEEGNTVLYLAIRGKQGRFALV